jgi:hypothetical protein
MGIRASGRVLEKSHTSIMRWEQKLAAQTHQWSPCVPAVGDITIEGLKSILAYTRTFPPSESNGWTVTFIEIRSHYH